jgi:hypothetical protein
VHDYEYSNSPCDHHGKFSYEYDYGYDCEGFYDLFSFEETASIPAEHRWGVLSRIVCWLRRVRARYLDEPPSLANGGLSISSPLPLGEPTVAALRRKRELEAKRRSPSPMLRQLSCTG